ncbi:MAG TPA: cation diffusion facilitator family transporter [Micromonosporaceae bacterium]|jgi:cation diffusion facilitator family transporter
MTEGHGHGGGKRAIVAALGANLGIALTKFIAFLLTSSSAMLAESIHSVADSGNQVLLLVGGKRARRAATPQHPFGFGRERYLYAFIVSIVLFSLGGLFALYEGYEKVTHPHPIDQWQWVPLTVLGVAVLMEAFSFRTAIKESNPARNGASWIQFIRRSREPELPVVLLEDSAALVGLVFALLGVELTILTGNGVFDGIASLLIGALLVTVAVVLATETKSLLIGESATGEHVRRIEEALVDGSTIERVIHMKTLHLGPDELLVAVKVGVAASATAGDIAAAIDGAEIRVRTAVPIARVIYIEPDIFRGAVTH